MGSAIGEPDLPSHYSSCRTIPLTKKSYAILEELYEERSTRKESPKLAQILELMDLKSGKEDHFCMRDLVFVNFRTGMPTQHSAYDTHLDKICEKAEIKHICTCVGRRYVGCSKKIEEMSELFARKTTLNRPKLRMM